MSQAFDPRGLCISLQSNAAPGLRIQLVGRLKFSMLARSTAWPRHSLYTCIYIYIARPCGPCVSRKARMLAGMLFSDGCAQMDVTSLHNQVPPAKEFVDGTPCGGARGRRRGAGGSLQDDRGVAWSRFFEAWELPVVMTSPPALTIRQVGPRFELRPRTIKRPHFRTCSPRNPNPAANSHPASTALHG